MKIAVDSAIPYIKGVLEPWGEVRYCAEIGLSEALWADALVVRTRTRCDERLLGGTPVRLVASATAGFDHIDVDYCAEKGIEAVWAPGCNARGVLQWVAAALAHCLPEGAQGGLSGSLDGDSRGSGVGRPLTLGVVGVGAVGGLVAEYAAHWGFRVLLCDPPKNLGISFEELAAQSDIITFHTPLTRTGEHATFHIADAKFFSLVKTNALILNASRGEVVDQRALLASVDGVGQGCRFCVDTWECEPNVTEDAAGRALLERTALATPHIAGYTVQGKANAAAAAVRAVARHFDLQPRKVSHKSTTLGRECDLDEVVDLKTWYPAGITPPAPQLIGWSEMRAAMPRHFDIAAESRLLKAAPADFERMRNNYLYREEFF